MVNFETFKKTISLLENNNIKYWVYGGFAFDGIRKELSREHGDIDIYISSNDLDSVKRLFPTDKYTFIQKEKMYFIESENFKIGIVLITKDADYLIAHGNKTVVRFPNQIWKNKNIEMINGVQFNCVPIEILAFDSQFSRYEEDKILGSKLEYNKDLFNLIKII